MISCFCVPGSSSESCPAQCLHASVRLCARTHAGVDSTQHGPQGHHQEAAGGCASRAKAHVDVVNQLDVAVLVNQHVLRGPKPQQQTTDPPSAIRPYVPTLAPAPDKSPTAFTCRCRSHCAVSKSYMAARTTCVRFSLVCAGVQAGDEALRHEWALVPASAHPLSLPIAAGHVAAVPSPLPQGHDSVRRAASCLEERALPRLTCRRLTASCSTAWLRCTTSWLRLRPGARSIQRPHQKMWMPVPGMTALTGASHTCAQLIQGACGQAGKL